MAATTNISEEILILLEEGEASLREIVDLTALTPRQVSNALSYLRKKGAARKGGRKKWFAKGPPE